MLDVLPVLGSPVTNAFYRGFKGYRPPALKVNGIEVKWDKSLAGVRSKYLCPEAGVIIKLNTCYKGDYDNQCTVERVLWESVSETDDARYFAPILDYGVITCYREERPTPTSPWEPTTVTWEWSAQTLITFDTTARPTKATQDEIQRIIEEYQLSDISAKHANQWKMIGPDDYDFIIHDYGFSGIVTP